MYIANSSNSGKLLFAEKDNPEPRFKNLYIDISNFNRGKSTVGRSSSLLGAVKLIKI